MLMFTIRLGSSVVRAPVSPQCTAFERHSAITVDPGREITLIETARAAASVVSHLPGTASRGSACRPEMIYGRLCRNPERGTKG